ncbi:hypothetical protein GQ44DRAFT_723535 [Phaeosphaeriaceae sp. PMI808]|nr:hypothetical protein GQ44DRAFT_723535 [Phaeosphaeriaceae sp. PMI808]
MTDHYATTINARDLDSRLNQTKAPTSINDPTRQSNTMPGTQRPRASSFESFQLPKFAKSNTMSTTSSSGSDFSQIRTSHTMPQTKTNRASAQVDAGDSSKPRINARSRRDTGDSARSTKNIYRDASEVIIWLGEGTTKTARYFSRMAFLAKSRKSQWLLKRFPFNAQIKIVLAFGGLSTEEIEKVFYNDWTTRVWTIQEQALVSDPTVMCGNSKVSWKAFLNFMMLPQNTLITNTGVWLFRTLVSMLFYQCLPVSKHDGLLSPQEKVDFLALCAQLSCLSVCSDDLDKVYALYSLLTGYFEHLPSVEYAVSKATLYEEFARYAIQSSEKFWPASMYSWRADIRSNTPSWVPDLVSRQYNRPGTTFDEISYFVKNCNLHPSASRDSTATLFPLPSSKTGALSINGFSFATITRSVERCPNYEKPFDLVLMGMFAAWRALRSNRKTLENPYQRSGGTLLALGEIFLYRAVVAFDVIEFRDCFHKAMLWFDSLPVVDSQLAEVSLSSGHASFKFWKSPKMRTFLFHTAESMSNSFLFTTSTEHIGITVGPVKPGDVVALLTGADLPVILRKKK